MIYADCQVREIYNNEYTGQEFPITLRYRFVFVNQDIADAGGIIQEFTEIAKDDNGDINDTLITGGIVDGDGPLGDDGSDEESPFRDFLDKLRNKLKNDTSPTEILRILVETAGGAAVGGATIGGMTGGESEGGSEDKKKKEEEITYRMVVGKNFGGGLKKGDTKSNTIIYAKIKAYRDGIEIENDPTAIELTKSIQILDYLDGVAQVDNLIYSFTYSRKEGHVFIPDARTQAKSCRVSVCFVGKGGKYREHIKFKVYGNAYVEFLNPGPGPKDEKMLAAGKQDPRAGRQSATSRRRFSSSVINKVPNFS